MPDVPVQPINRGRSLPPEDRGTKTQTTGSLRPSSPAPVSATCQFLHLFGLNALAIVQPVLGRLSGNGPYIEMEEFRSVTLWLMLVLIMTGLPLLMVATVCLFNLLRPWAGVYVFRVFLFVMMTLLIHSFLNWTSNYFEGKSRGVPDSWLLIVAAVQSVFFLRWYIRFPLVAQGLSFASVSAMSVPIMFVSSAQMQPYLFPKASPIHFIAPHFDNPVPVVMIVFDGMNGMTLLNEQLQLDAVRYPSFARLAKSGNWYRNASTVHYRTSNAVPSILTGCLPSDKLMPSESDHPDNLLRRIYDSGQYEMTIFEPFTLLRPQEMLREAKSADLLTQEISLIRTLTLVYLDTTLPDEFSWVDAITPLSWFAVRDTQMADQSAGSGLMQYGWDAERLEQLNHFRECLTHSDKPTFRFLHVVIPHYPWCYLPSGKAYGELRVVDVPDGTHGTLGEDWGPDQLACDQAWQRYLFQVGMADRCLGEILDQMESEKIFDQSLVIVMADHGEAFTAGTSRRVPTAATLEDIVPVPLFLKLPFQKSSLVSDENVETIDVFPTIADILKMTPELTVDGSSLVCEQHVSRLRKQVTGPDGTIILEPDFPGRFNYARKMTALFGSGDSNKLLSAVNVLPDLPGLRISEMTVSDEPGVPLVVNVGHAGIVTVSESYVPCYIRGYLKYESPAQPVNLAIAVNGRIQGTTRTYNDPSFAGCWAGMLPESAFQEGQNEIAIYEVQTIADSVILRRCPTSGH